jgi:hypothetical protein
MKSTTLELDSMPPLSLESFHFQSFVIEALLVIGVCAFWLATLPFVAAALIVLKIWNRFLFRPRPLLFRRQVCVRRGLSRVNLGVQIPDLRSLRIKSRCLSGP